MAQSMANLQLHDTPFTSPAPRFVTLTLSKANLQLYDAKKKGTDSDTHWHRLLTDDQFVERGMVSGSLPRFFVDAALPPFVVLSHGVGPAGIGCSPTTNRWSGVW
jgi:hypothetical protein